MREWAQVSPGWDLLIAGTTQTGGADLDWFFAKRGRAADLLPDIEPAELAIRREIS